MRGFDSRSRLTIMINPEYEKVSSQEELEDRDQSGFSEKQRDINVEKGVFRKANSKKIIFEKKHKK